MPGIEITPAQSRKLAKLKQDFLTMNDDRASSFVESLRARRRRRESPIVLKEPKAPKVAKVKVPKAKTSKLKESESVEIESKSEIQEGIEGEIENQAQGREENKAQGKKVKGLAQKIKGLAQKIKGLSAEEKARIRESLDQEEAEVHASGEA